MGRGARVVRKALGIGVEALRCQEEATQGGQTDKGVSASPEGNHIGVGSWERAAVARGQVQWMPRGLSRATGAHQYPKVTIPEETRAGVQRGLETSMASHVSLWSD